jgi:outer membrane protein TolC
MDWEGRVLQFKNMQDGAQLGLLNARLGILRALDLDRTTEIEISQDLVTAPPAITYEEAMREALKNRTDLANLRAALAISENQYDIAKNNSLPSVTANAGIGYNDYDDKSAAGSLNTINRQWNVGITVSKSLGGVAEEAEERSARNAFLKRRLEIKQLESGISDEIRVRLDKCQTAFSIYTQTAQASDYARRYYESIYRKYEQGRYETTQLKLAFDNYINQRNNALKSLVDYNLALLELDVAKNTVFEKYSIDVDALVAQNIKE